MEEEARKSNESRRNLTYQQKEAKRYQREAEDLAMQVMLSNSTDFFQYYFEYGEFCYDVFLLGFCIQVQILTKELHIAKGGRVSDDDVSTQVTSSSQPGSADYVISTQLVSFR